MKVRQWYPTLGEEEKRQLLEVVDSGWLTESRKTSEFEQLIREFTGCKYAVATVSGGVALYLLLKAVDVGVGDEVIVPDYQMIALANAVKMTGATPVFADVYKESGTITHSSVVQARTEKTKAIVPVHMNGRAADIDCLRACHMDSMVFVEDSCQAMGSEFHNKKLGTFSLAGCYSFHPSKIITTGQGGVIFTDNVDVYESVKRMKDYGRLGRESLSELPDYFAFWGFNFRFTEFQAAIGIAQFKQLGWRLRRMREMYRMYREGIKLDMQETDDQDGFVPWVCDIQLAKRGLNKQLKALLEKEGVETRLPYTPLHKQPLYHCFGDFSGADFWSETCLWLPSSPYLKNEEIQYVIDKVNEVGQKLGV